MTPWIPSLGCEDHVSGHPQKQSTYQPDRATPHLFLPTGELEVTVEDYEQMRSAGNFSMKPVRRTRAESYRRKAATGVKAKLEVNASSLNFFEAGYGALRHLVGNEVWESFQPR
jgi:hypothetical protein